jgi:hypothetical protein
VNRFKVAIQSVPQIDLFEMIDQQGDDGMALKLHGAHRLTLRS